MAKKAKTNPAAKTAITPVTKPGVNPGIAPTINIDARISVGMFFTLTGTILSAFGLSTRGNGDLYARSLGIDANLWWGLTLLTFGILLLAFGRVGQSKMDKAGK